MFITTNPKGNTYKELIDLSFEICDEFILVVRSDIDINSSAKNVLEKLRPSLKAVKEQFEWPGTRYFGEKPAQVYYYRADDYAKEILKQVSNSLHDWLQPKLPEDLSFIKCNQPWLVNTSHEQESHIITEDKEEIGLLSRVKGLDIMFFN